VEAVSSTGLTDTYVSEFDDIGMLSEPEENLNLFLGIAFLLIDNLREKIPG